MGKFADYLASLEGIEGGYPDTLIADITGAYDADIAGIQDGAAAKVAQLTQTIQAQEAEISALKAHNYDLLMAGAPSEDETPEDDETPDDDNDEEKGVDSLFGEDE